AHLPALRSWTRMRKPAARSKKPIAQCMCAKRSAGTSRDAFEMSALSRGGTTASGARLWQRRAAARNRRLQFQQLCFQKFIGHDQRLDGAAQIAVAHRDRLVAGILVVAIVEGGRGYGHGEDRACWGGHDALFTICSCRVKRTRQAGSPKLRR